MYTAVRYLLSGLYYKACVEFIDNATLVDLSISVTFTLV
jgi:hypothetical protein